MLGSGGNPIKSASVIVLRVVAIRQRFGWRYTWHQDDPKDEFRFECNECIYAKILGKRNLMKLGAMCCHADIINYGSLPYTDFIRTETLCRGGDVCDFRFVRHATDAGDGRERTKSV